MIIKKIFAHFSRQNTSFSSCFKLFKEKFEAKINFFKAKFWFSNRHLSVESKIQNSETKFCCPKRGLVSKLGVRREIQNYKVNF